MGQDNSRERLDQLRRETRLRMQYCDECQAHDYVTSCCADNRCEQALCYRCLEQHYLWHSLACGMQEPWHPAIVEKDIAWARLEKAYRSHAWHNRRANLGSND